MKDKVARTFPKMHWAIYEQPDGSHRGYLDGWFYGLPEFSCLAPSSTDVESRLKSKLDEWKASGRAFF
jgi:hypothetical protein